MDVLNFISPLFLALAVGGTFVGIVFGSIPGLTATMAVAVCRHSVDLWMTSR